LRGAALASVLTQVATFVALGFYATRAAGLREHVLFQRIWGPDPGAMREVFRLGWPIGLTNLAESGMFSASALIIGLIGKLPLAAHGIARVVGATMVAFLGVPELLIRGFIAPDEPQRDAILVIGAQLLAVAALFQLVDAGQVMALGVLRGIQDTRVPMVLAALSYWVMGIPASYILGITLGYGGVGVWMGVVVGLAFATVLLWWRFLQMYRALKAG